MTMPSVAALGNAGRSAAVAMMVGMVMLANVSVAQSSDSATESLIDQPEKPIDFVGCFADLNTADRDQDGFLKQNEYLSFIQEYGKRVCFTTDALTLQQTATFNTLACICRQQDNASDDCCISSNAQIPTAGSTVPQDEQTTDQTTYLTSVCKLTDSAMDGQCAPETNSTFVPAAAASTVTSSDSPNGNSTVTTTDESLVDRPDKPIDFIGCFSDLNTADRDQDGFLKQNEYLSFIQEYGKRVCFTTDALSLQQSATFNTLACICRQQDSASDDCCLGSNAQIPTAGSTVPQEEQTTDQRNFLTSICKLTDDAIDGQCAPDTNSSFVPSRNSSSDNNSTAATSEESLVGPANDIDFAGCFADLYAADADLDGFVQLDEYITFIQEYGQRICYNASDYLSLQQKATFNTLACICHQEDGASDDCCLGSNAQIPAIGANLSETEQTPNQEKYLRSVCKLTDATLESHCRTPSNSETDLTSNAGSTPANETNTTNATGTVVSSIERDTVEPVSASPSGARIGFTPATLTHALVAGMALLLGLFL